MRNQANAARPFEHADTTGLLDQFQTDYIRTTDYRNGSQDICDDDAIESDDECDAIEDTVAAIRAELVVRGAL